MIANSFSYASDILTKPFDNPNMIKPFYLILIIKSKMSGLHFSQFTGSIYQRLLGKIGRPVSLRRFPENNKNIKE